MRSLLCLLVSTAVALAPPLRAQPQSDDFLGARIEVERGRVLLVRSDAPVEVLRPDHPVDIGGAAHLEIGAGARACVSWRGMASLRLYGPVALEWNGEPLALRGIDGSLDLAQSVERALEWRVLDLGRIEVELRAGRARIVLPEGWVSWLTAGAFRVEGRPRGGFEIENRAGQAVKIGRELSRERVRPAFWLSAGNSAPLVARPDEERSIDHTTHARPWPSVEWPWGAPTATVAPMQPEPESPPAHEAGSGAAPPAPAAVPEPVREPPLPLPAERTLETAHSASPPESVRADDAHGQAPESVAVAPQSLPVASEPAPATAVRAARAFVAFDPAHWRGFARALLAPSGPVVLEAARGLTLKAVGEGRFEVALERGAAGHAWVLGPLVDIELEPGTRAFVDAAGELRGHIGSIQVAPAPAERPRWSELAPPEPP